MRSEPFHRTTDAEPNPEPLTVSVKAAPPAVAFDGESEVIDGAGLLMVKVDPLDAPPPGDGLKTITVAVPGIAMSLAVIEAVS